MNPSINTATSLLKRFSYRNEGRYDRLVRLIVGSSLMTLGFFTTPWLSGLGIWVGFTALIGWCPLYSALGVSTCAVQKASNA